MSVIYVDDLNRPIQIDDIGRPIILDDLTRALEIGDDFNMGFKGYNVTRVDNFNPEVALGSYLIDMIDPRRLDLMTSNSGYLSSIRSSKLGHNFSQASSLLQPTVSIFPSGRASILFDGADDYLTYTSAPSWPLGADGVLILMKVNNLSQPAALEPGNKTMLAYGGTGASNRIDLRRSTPSGFHRPSFSVGTGAGSTVVTPTSDFSGIHVLKALSDGTNISLDMDGIVNSSAAAITATGATRARLGANTAGTAASFFNGHIGPVFICSPSTPPTLVEQVQSWLTAY